MVYAVGYRDGYDGERDSQPAAAAVIMAAGLRKLEMEIQLAWGVN